MYDRIGAELGDHFPYPRAMFAALVVCSLALVWWLGLFALGLGIAFLAASGWGAYKLHVGTVDKGMGALVFIGVLVGTMLVVFATIQVLWGHTHFS